MNKRFNFESDKMLTIRPYDSFNYHNCNYTSLTAFRRGNGYSVTVYFFAVRDNKFTVVNSFSRIVDTIPELYNLAKQHVKINKIY